ncbi:methyltransferase domain-containing protein [Aquimonas sp.]|jgi:ubiquinone/menaquinone biosynthesis C-methylase UbiE|uniref:methyltransferase domain-containing protein n=1 Tax=Aquimonas sp. TaxID=1872588 RepID=UPI0037BF486F
MIARSTLRHSEARDIEAIRAIYQQPSVYANTLQLPFPSPELRRFQLIGSDFVNSLPYPEFVGFINQWNVLPGSFNTLSKWALFSRLDERSRLLQVACTTGFQARELALMTGCTAHGFDRATHAVRAAKYNATRYAPNAMLSYEEADGYQFEPTEKYTHIAVGAGLKFFTDPEAALRRFVGFLDDGGYVLASPFYVNAEVPEPVVEQARAAFGITPTLERYDEVMRPYRELEILYEDRCELALEPADEIERYCDATIKRFVETTADLAPDAITAAKNRREEPPARRTAGVQCAAALPAVFGAGAEIPSGDLSRALRGALLARAPMPARM